MTTVPAALFGPTPIPSATPTVMYTSPASTKTVITRAVVTNESNGAATLTIWVVRNGNTPVNGNILVGAAAAGQSQAAGPAEPYVVNGLAGMVLSAGDAIYAQSGTNDVLNFVGSGWLQT